MTDWQGRTLKGKDRNDCKVKVVAWLCEKKMWTFFLNMLVGTFKTSVALTLTVP